MHSCMHCFVLKGQHHRSTVLFVRCLEPDDCLSDNWNLSVFFAHVLQVSLEMQAAHPDSFHPELPADYASAATEYHRPPVRGVQFHHPVPEANDGSAEVGKDYRHMSADLQVRRMSCRLC